jgi:Ca2+-binding EF-hand superfamily protein
VRTGASSGFTGCFHPAFTSLQCDEALGCGALPIPALALFLASAAAQPSNAGPAPRHYGRLFISPMGEPFWANAPGEDALTDWFRQADRDHDGFLSVNEMAQDADRFFEALDKDHDGELDPDEVSHYELDIVPEVQGEPMAMREVRQNSEDADGAAIDSNDPDMGISGGGSDGAEGAGRFSLLSIPEPVAGADTNLDRSISRDEFRHAAVDRFQLLDPNHNGRLTLAQLEAMRPSSPLGAFRHHGGHQRPQDGASPPVSR